MGGGENSGRDSTRYSSRLCISERSDHQTRFRVLRFREFPDPWNPFCASGLLPRGCCLLPRTLCVLLECVLFSFQHGRFISVNHDC